jgi:serine-type D-Ala-D-Ala endopeptidase (penicillin-binding protein 7)
MEDDDQKSRRFYAVRYEDDIPKPGKGMLIPYDPAAKQIAPYPLTRYASVALVPLTALLFMVTISFLGAETYGRLNTASLPAVSVVNPFTAEVKPLTYGVQTTLAEPNFFAETRNAFIDEAVTFVEVDLTTYDLRYFKDGVLYLSFPILAKGEVGSWWQTPAGLYAAETKNKRYYSSVGSVYLPWSITFQGNFLIHGWPEYDKDMPVPEDFAGGGIRLSTADAEELFALIKTNTPILVYEEEATPEQFVYEPTVPALTAPHYLIADVESNTILAASDVEAVAPIASVTKLMTALVAAETINLDTTVAITQPTFVQSLIPRIGERSRVSMYSLLQLLLVESSNEAAEVIAAQADREKFISSMNEKAKSLGMEETYFVDPSGLGAGNISSLRDLFRLAQYIYQNRSFIFEVTANQNLKTAHQGGEFGQLVNFNQVDDLDNLIGGKVGETIAAGQTSVTLHRLTVKGEERVVAIIILGSKERNADVTKLYRYAEERFTK